MLSECISKQPDPTPSKFRACGKTKSFILPIYERQDRICVGCGGKVRFSLFYFHIFLLVSLKPSFANKRNGKVCVTTHSTSKRSDFKAPLLLILTFSQLYCFSVLFLCLTELEILFIIRTPILRLKTVSRLAFSHVLFLLDPRIGKMCPSLWA